MGYKNLILLFERIYEKIKDKLDIAEKEAILRELQIWRAREKGFYW